MEQGGWLLMTLDAAGETLHVALSGPPTPSTLAHALAAQRHDFSFVLWRQPRHAAPLLLYCFGASTPVGRRSSALAKAAEVARRVEPVEGLVELKALLAAELQKEIEAAVDA